jgi:hypothetical protein
VEDSLILFRNLQKQAGLSPEEGDRPAKEAVAAMRRESIAVSCFREAATAHSEGDQMRALQALLVNPPEPVLTLRRDEESRNWRSTSAAMA